MDNRPGERGPHPEARHQSNVVLAVGGALCIVACAGMGGFAFYAAIASDFVRAFKADSSGIDEVLVMCLVSGLIYLLAGIFAIRGTPRAGLLVGTLLTWAVLGWWIIYLSTEAYRIVLVFLLAGGAVAGLLTAGMIIQHREGPVVRPRGRGRLPRSQRRV